VCEVVAEGVISRIVAVEEGGTRVCASVVDGTSVEQATRPRAIVAKSRACKQLLPFPNPLNANVK